MNLTQQISGIKQEISNCIKVTILYLKFIFTKTILFYTLKLLVLAIISIME